MALQCRRYSKKKDFIWTFKNAHCERVNMSLLLPVDDGTKEPPTRLAILRDQTVDVEMVMKRTRKGLLLALQVWGGACVRGIATHAGRMHTQLILLPACLDGRCAGRRGRRTGSR